MKLPRIQFRLRTLLIVITVLAVALGWFTNRLRQAERQRDAVAKLHQFGSDYEVVYDWNWNFNDNCQIFGGVDEMAQPTWARRLLGNDFFDRVVAVRPQFAFFPQPGHVVSAKALPLLAALPDLRSLDWQCDQIVDDINVAQISVSHQLRVLNLSGTSVTNDGLAVVARISGLEKLELAGLPLTDAALVPLQSLRRLKRLNLEGTKISGRHLDCFNALAELEVLILSKTNLELADLDKLKLPKLRSLDVHGIGVDPLPAGATLPPQLFDGLPKLEMLVVSGQAPATTGLPGLESLDADEQPGLPSGLMAAIVRLPNLTTIIFTGREVTDADLKQLDNLPHLHTLALCGAKISDGGLHWLARLPELTTIYVDVSRPEGPLTDEGFAELQRALPKLSIISQYGNFDGKRFARRDSLSPMLEDLRSEKLRLP